MMQLQLFRCNFQLLSTAAPCQTGKKTIIYKCSDHSISTLLLRKNAHVVAALCESRVMIINYVYLEVPFRFSFCFALFFFCTYIQVRN